MKFDSTSTDRGIANAIAQLNDDQVDRDDRRLQRDRQAHEEQRVRRAQMPAGAPADDRERRHEGEEHHRDHRADHDDDGVDEVLDEVRLEDQPVGIERDVGRRLQRVLGEVDLLALQAGDHDPVDRDHHDREP
jgi:hypothetical protein